MGFPGGSDCKESACNEGNLSSIPGWGRSPGGGHGNPLQYSCLENPHRQRSLAGYSPWGRKELDTTEQLNTAQNVIVYMLITGLLGGSVGEKPACNAGATGDKGLIPALGRFPGGGNGNPLQYSILENPMDRGGWWATVHGITKSRTWLKHAPTHMRVTL